MGMLALDESRIPPAKSTRPASQRVLLAEDDDDTRRYIATVLRNWGYDVVEACDGADLLSCLENWELKGPFSAIIADHHMPYLEGLDVLAALGCANWSMPFVIMTADDGQTLKMEALGLGASAFLTKPVTREKLDQALESALRAK